MFQFLLGTVQLSRTMLNEPDRREFQFLLGTVQQQIFSIVTNILFYFFHKFNLFPYKKSVDLIFRQTDVDLYNLTFPRLFVFLRNFIPRSTDFLSFRSVRSKFIVFTDFNDLYLPLKQR